MPNQKTSIALALAASFLLGAVVVAYSSAQYAAPQTEDNASHAPHQKVSTSFSDKQEEEIGELVRAYLMENPEVILQAVEAYRTRQQMAQEEYTRTAATANIAKLIDANTAFVSGKNPDKAKVAVIEMYDYHCGYCKSAAGVVSQLVKNDADVKVVFRELPILKQESFYAAEMALAARDQGKFLDFHFAMLNASGTLSADRVDDIAKKAGLDVAKMKAEVEAGEPAQIIDENHSLAAAMEVDGTPTFIIAAVDGSYVDTIVGFSEAALKQKIAEAKKPRVRFPAFLSTPLPPPPFAKR
ncbi:MAG: DsbA family protein [Parvularculaceae bacterium]